MRPKNIMEDAVQGALFTHRQAGPGGDTGCWCPLCTADVQALALSSLPPRYVTRRRCDAGEEHGRHDAVRDQVARAVQRVGSNRKHDAGTDVSTTLSVAVVNVALEVGFALMEERLQGLSGTCECWDCRCDAIAFALNRFPAQYGVAIDGKSRFHEGSRRQMAEEMVGFLDLGIQVVTAHPLHGQAATRPLAPSSPSELHPD